MFETRYLLPPNLKEEELIKVLLYAFDKGLQEINSEIRDFCYKLLPDAAPGTWLPWLFYVFGAEDYIYPLHDEAWLRRILKNIFNLYKAKGTVEGIKLHIDILTPAKFLQVHHAPAKVFLSSITEEEKKLFESKMPRIRVYPYKHKGKLYGMACGVSYLGDSGERKGLKSYIVMSDAFERILDYVELYDPVTETVQHLNYYAYDKSYIEKKAKRIIEFRKRSRLKTLLFYGGFVYGHFINQEAWRRLYTIELYESYKDDVTKRHSLSLTPSLIPVRTWYREEKVKGRKRWFCLGNKYTDVYKDRYKCFLGVRSYLIRSDADERIRKVLTLFDPKRAVYHVYKSRHTRFFIGGSRIGGLKTHHTELYVDTRRHTSRYKFFVCDSTASKKFMTDSNAKELLHWILWAAGKERRAGEKMTLSITNTKVITASEAQLCGKAVCGEWKLGVI